MRSPLHHPSVIFRKSVVSAAGGYPENIGRFEDYLLWERLILNGAVLHNVPTPWYCIGWIPEPIGDAVDGRCSVRNCGYSNSSGAMDSSLVHNSCAMLVSARSTAWFLRRFAEPLIMH